MRLFFWTGMDGGATAAWGRVKTRNCVFKTRNFVFKNDEFCRSLPDLPNVSFVSKWRFFNDSSIENGDSSMIIQIENEDFSIDKWWILQIRHTRWHGGDEYSIKNDDFCIRNGEICI